MPVEADGAAVTNVGVVLLNGVVNVGRATMGGRLLVGGIIAVEAGGRGHEANPVPTPPGIAEPAGAEPQPPT